MLTSVFLTVIVFPAQREISQDEKEEEEKKKKRRKKGEKRKKGRKKPPQIPQKLCDCFGNKSWFLVGWAVLGTNAGFWVGVGLFWEQKLFLVGLREVRVVTRQWKAIRRESGRWMRRCRWHWQVRNSPFPMVKHFKISPWSFTVRHLQKMGKCSSFSYWGDFPTELSTDMRGKVGPANAKLPRDTGRNRGLRTNAGRGTRNKVKFVRMCFCYWSQNWMCWLPSEVGGAEPVRRSACLAAWALVANCLASWDASFVALHVH